MSGITLESFDNLSKFRDIIHFQTNRLGGHSIGKFDSLNMGYSDNEQAELVIENRRLVAQSVGVELDKFIFANQTHSSNVYVVTDRDRGRGVYDNRKDEIENVDALVTDRAQVMLCVKTADCVPILFYDPIRRVIAAAHAGWRGTAGRIAIKCVQRMVNDFDCSVNDIIAGIGVSAGICCYEVGYEVLERLTKSIEPHYSIHDYYQAGSNDNKFMVDVKRVNQIQLQSIGIPPQNIELKSECTICNCDRYFSARAANGTSTGRLACGIMLR